MILNEAIKHCEERIDCTKCGREHAQLKDWLVELNQLRQETERKHGYWERYTRNFGGIPIGFSYCSICEALAIGIESKFCPNCGAIMDGKEPIKDEQENQEKA